MLALRRRTSGAGSDDAAGSSTGAVLVVGPVSDRIGGWVVCAGTFCTPQAARPGQAGTGDGFFQRVFSFLFIFICPLHRYWHKELPER